MPDEVKPDDPIKQAELIRQRRARNALGVASLLLIGVGGSLIHPSVGFIAVGLLVFGSVTVAHLRGS